MINDLKIFSSDEIRFIDDLTVSETVTKSCSSNIQHAVSEIEVWSELNLFKLNENKCKEMRLTLRQVVTDFPPSKLMENRRKLLMKQNYWVLLLRLT